MKNKKGVTQFQNTVELVLMIFLVIMGVLLLNVTSNGNITSAKEKANIERDSFQAKQQLQVFTMMPIHSSIGDMPLSQALNNYYNLQLQDYLNKSQKDLRNNLESEIKKDTSILFKKYFVIKSDVYRDTVSQDKEITLYSAGFDTDLTYITSAIIPSSYSRAGDYYINISMYYTKRAYAEGEN